MHLYLTLSFCNFYRNRQIVSANSSRVTEENWDDDIKKESYHLFPLPEEFIHVIDNEHKLRWMLDDELNGVEMIGFDAEWKPAFGAVTTSLALLQIATLDKVYILDLIAIKGNSHWWYKFGSHIFGNENIIKLGNYFFVTLNTSLLFISHYTSIFLIIKYLFWQYFK